MHPRGPAIGLKQAFGNDFLSKRQEQGIYAVPAFSSTPWSLEAEDTGIWAGQMPN